MKIHENILVFSKSAACFVKNPMDAMKYNPQYRKGKPYRSKAMSTSKNYDAKAYKPFETVNDGEHYQPIDIIQFGYDIDRFHPTQKPVDLLRYLVLTYTNEGETVLDSCIGSGTTAIACLKEHRHFLGFELNKEYFDIAQRRIRLERQQPQFDFADG